ncbi:MAG TPA: hypothetical protein VJ246_02145 [Patescibacteria group bacterium]|nr:hypothetical protein [Patescibacteria group bacterium]
MFGRIGAGIDRMLGMSAEPKNKIKWGAPEVVTYPSIHMGDEVEQTSVDRWRQILDTFVDNPGKVSSLDVEHIDQLRETFVELFLKEKHAMLAFLALQDLQRTQKLFDELVKHAGVLSEQIDKSAPPTGKTRQQEAQLEVLVNIRVVIKNLWGKIEAEIQRKKAPTQT